MKTQKVWHFLELYIVFLLLGGTIVIAADMYQIPICTHTAYQDYPAVSGDIVVWQDNRNGSWDIYAYDLYHQMEYPICTQPGDQTRPAISGQYVVWMDTRNGSDDIYAYHLVIQTELAICTDAADQQFPDISGAMIVWQDHRNGNWDIYGYQLGLGGGERIFTTHAGDQISPGINDSKVVWQDSRNGGWDIYGGDLVAHTEFPICTNGSPQQVPKVSGNFVVWHDYRNGAWDIYGANIGATPIAECSICTHMANQTYPLISGTAVTWVDFRNDKPDVYGYDIARKQELEICTGLGNHYVHGMDGRMAVWADNRNGNWDIYAAVLGQATWSGCSAIDFECMPVDLVVTNQYEGVVFSAPGGNCTGSAVIVNMEELGGTSSGVQALGTQAGQGCEFSPEHLQMVFDWPQQRVSFTVGPYCGNYVIQAYDDVSGGSLVASQTVEIPGCMALHGVHHHVQLVSSQRNIKRIEIDAGTGASETIDDLLFNTDDTPPVARIDSPGFHACSCELVNVMGEACDPDGDIGLYTLEYRPVDAAEDTWILIYSSTEQRCGSEELGIWNTSELIHGYYYLRLTATNTCGLSATAVTTAYVDKIFDSVDIRYPDNRGVIRGSSVCFDGTVWDNICFDYYSVKYRPLGGANWLPVDQANLVYTSSVMNDPFARWNTLTVADGNYETLVEAVDSCGNTAQQTRHVTVDNTPPTAVIASPMNCSYFQGMIDIIGTAFDANLDSWTLQYTGGTANSWVTIASAGSAVMNNVLGTWNTVNLPDCAYTLRLQVWDRSRLDCSGIKNHSEYTVSVNIGSAASNPDLNGDGCVNLDDFAVLAAHWLEGCEL
ncbi:MAG: PD40 domain-containing protein [Sedimentisphaerales bacterium]|nr:PD40 domain-containing protein [Sedimentisphaerales bacterium]